MLPARANQRLLGKGWSGMGRVKGVGGQAVRGVIVVFVSMGWLRERNVGGDGRGGGMAKDGGSMSEVPSRSRAGSKLPSEDSGSLGGRVIRLSVVSGSSCTALQSLREYCFDFEIHRAFSSLVVVSSGPIWDISRVGFEIALVRFFLISPTKR